MGGSTEGSRWLRAVMVPAFALAAAVAADCGGNGGGAGQTGGETGTAQPSQQGGGARPTPAPPRGTMDSAWRSQVAAFAAQQLQFDTMPPAADTATFAVGADTSRVTFSPEIGAAGIPESALAQGWVIGRVQVTGTTPPYGFPAGTSWIWIDSTSAGWRLVQVPETASDSMRQRTLMLGSSRFDSAAPPRAMHTSIDSLANWRCGTRCCIDPYGRKSLERMQEVVEEMHRRP